MLTVFYDLETTDKLFCGQILNYSFIEVGDDFEVRSECSGKIHVSRLQIPSPEAILANRTDLCAHQAENPPKEREALAHIWSYLAELIANNDEPLRLIGYNSSKFDLPFLRTSFIRCGINPYFEGKLVSGDLLFASRKLSCTHPDFPRPGGPDGRLSLRLESLTHEFGLLKEAQTHESRDDVILTISLAKLYREMFGLDVRKFSAYEVPAKVSRGEVYYSTTPNYEAGVTARHEHTPMVLLETDHRQALWINLKRYVVEKELQGEAKFRNAVSWYSKSTHSFFCGEETLSDDIRSLAREALEALSNINLKSFFSRSTCDIEQDIYRLDFGAIEALRLAIWERDTTKLKSLKNDDALAIYNRHRISHYPGGGTHDAKVDAMLRDYALYRYGGQMPISKGGAATCHETFRDMFGRLQSLRAAADGSNRSLLESLEKYYCESDIYRVAGADLLKMPERPAAAAVNGA